MKKLKYSKVVVLLVIILVVWFSNKTLNVFMVTNNEPVVLTTAFFTFVTVELWNLKDLKKNERKKPKKEEDLSGE